MPLLVYWTLIIPALAVLVLVHELGHFLTARWFGVKALEFGFGFPPRMFAVRRAETLYSVNWLPLGGFVKLLDVSGRKESEYSDADRGRSSFSEQPPLKRIVMLLSGSAMNFLSALAIFTALFLLPYSSTFGVVTVGGEVPGSPAAVAGVRAGDRIIAVNGERFTDQYDLLDSIRASPGPELRLGVRSSEESGPRTVIVSPAQPDIGLIIARTDTELSPERRNLPDALWSAATRTQSSLTGLPSGLVSWVIGDAGLEFLSLGAIAPISAGAGVSPDLQSLALFLEILGFLSVNLGLLNVLPVPGLDGGKLLFVALEWARGGRRVSGRTETLTYLVGIAVLMGMVAALRVWTATS